MKSNSWVFYHWKMLHKINEVLLKIKTITMSTKYQFKIVHTWLSNIIKFLWMISILSYFIWNNLRRIIVRIWWDFTAYRLDTERIFIKLMLTYWVKLTLLCFKSYKNLSLILTNSWANQNYSSIHITLSSIIIIAAFRLLFKMILS